MIRQIEQLKCCMVLHQFKELLLLAIFTQKSIAVSNKQKPQRLEIGFELHSCNLKRQGNRPNIVLSSGFPPIKLNVTKLRLTYKKRLVPLNETLRISTFIVIGIIVTHLYMWSTCIKNDRPMCVPRHLARAFWQFSLLYDAHQH